MYIFICQGDRIHILEGGEGENPGRRQITEATLYNFYSPHKQRLYPFKARISYLNWEGYTWV